MAVPGRAGKMISPSQEVGDVCSLGRVRRAKEADLALTTCVLRHDNLLAMDRGVAKSAISKSNPDQCGETREHCGSSTVQETRQQHCLGSCSPLDDQVAPASGSWCLPRLLPRFRFLAARTKSSIVSPRAAASFSNFSTSCGPLSWRIFCIRASMLSPQCIQLHVIQVADFQFRYQFSILPCFEPMKLRESRSNGRSSPHLLRRYRVAPCL